MNPTAVPFVYKNKEIIKPLHGTLKTNSMIDIMGIHAPSLEILCKTLKLKPETIFTMVNLKVRPYELLRYNHLQNKIPSEDYYKIEAWKQGRINRALQFHGEFVDIHQVIHQLCSNKIPTLQLFCQILKFTNHTKNLMTQHNLIPCKLVIYSTKYIRRHGRKSGLHPVVCDRINMWKRQKRYCTIKARSAPVTPEAPKRNNINFPPLPNHGNSTVSDITTPTDGGVLNPISKAWKSPPPPIKTKLPLNCRNSPPAPSCGTITGSDVSATIGGGVLNPMSNPWESSQYRNNFPPLPVNITSFPADKIEKQCIKALESHIPVETYSWEDFGQQCVVCLNNIKTDVLLPCKHLCVCNECAILLHKCPLCRAEIKQILSVYT